VNKRNKTGLTIPFIIGAKSYFEPDSKLDNIFELFEIIRNSNTDCTFYLSKCPDVQEYVIGIKNRNNSMYGELYKNDFTGKVTLITTLSTEILGRNLQSIAKVLEGKYADCLSNKQYSKIQGKWAEYSKNDIEMINAAKNFVT